MASGGYVGYNYQLRVILIGDSRVGKTSLINELQQEQTGGLEHSLTLGVDYYSKVFHWRDQVVKLQVWDTAGQDRFRSIVKTYYRNAIGGLIVFDVTSRDSFDNVEGWLSEAREAHGDDQYVYILVGNKCDLTGDRVVRMEEARDYAAKNNMRYVETSAITGANVKEVFNYLVGGIMTMIEEGRVRMNRGSWDGVREGRLVTQSMLTSTHTALDVSVPVPDLPSQTSNEGSVEKHRKCSC